MTEQTDATMTDAERLTKLTAENESLKGDLAEFNALKQHTETQKTALAEAERTNAELREQHSVGALDNALRKAAKVLDVDPELVLNFHKHEFKTTTDAAGKTVVTPDPIVYLANRIHEGDVLLKPSQDATRTQKTDTAVLTSPEADPKAVLAALDRDPQKMHDFILKYGEEVYLTLAFQRKLPENFNR